jgi:hypothetical protein
VGVVRADFSRSPSSRGVRPSSHQETNAQASSVDPNPTPTSGARSETFVGAGSTVALAIPTTSTFITVGGSIIALNSGGTPVNALIPTGVSEVNGATPSWSMLYLHPPTALTCHINQHSTSYPRSPPPALRSRHPFLARRRSPRWCRPRPAAPSK